MRPSWSLVLRFDLAVRKEAARLVNDGRTYVAAMTAARKDAELRERQSAQNPRQTGVEMVRGLKLAEEKLTGIQSVWKLREESIPHGAWEARPTSVS